MAIPWQQEFELYHCNESLCSQKARLGFLEKVLAFKSHHIMLCDMNADCQNLSPEHLAINSKGQVPTLVHNGEPVYDAHRIVKHIDDAHPQSGERLWPTEAPQQALAEQWFQLGMLDDSRGLGTTFGTAIPVLTLPILAKLMERQPMATVAANMARHPVPMRRELFMRLREKGASELPPEVLEGALDSLCQGLATANGNLAEFGGPWLLGDFSLADITMMACFHRLQDVGLEAALQDPAVPHLSGYWERLQSRPSYAEGVTKWHDPGWRSAIEEIWGNVPSPLLDDVRRRLRTL